MSPKRIRPLYQRIRDIHESARVGALRQKIMDIETSGNIHHALKLLQDEEAQYESSCEFNF